ncbi:hypothetical protein G6O69_30715 [Pseudenhygromyxa sp. WMMC2535]|uniref:hypothetical protein n=1 Tax=Pseudenhygromyxa sp. WMMC2535 TaxID=2712867 RepID=UPI001552B95C|nr:hypothetical protein [Pseudenhygromyxa sp. WMMC2535]NVB42236.1 hypothetical protein [Pseudenhygromyxa sp. WMMC2535]
MFEALIAGLIIVALLLAAWLPPTWILWLGVGLGALGAIVGVPAGIVYHLRLWRALRAVGHPTAGMWIRPHALHEHLDEGTREGIRVIFALGAAGFVVTLIGAAGVVTAVARLLW